MGQPSKQCSCRCRTARGDRPSSEYGGSRRRRLGWRLADAGAGASGRTCGGELVAGYRKRLDNSRYRTGFELRRRHRLIGGPCRAQMLLRQLAVPVRGGIVRRNRCLVFRETMLPDPPANGNLTGYKSMHGIVDEAGLCANDITTLHGTDDLDRPSDGHSCTDRTTAFRTVQGEATTRLSPADPQCQHYLARWPSGSVVQRLLRVSRGPARIHVPVICGLTSDVQQTDACGRSLHQACHLIRIVTSACARSNHFISDND